MGLAQAGADQVDADQGRLRVGGVEVLEQVAARAAEIEDHGIGSRVAHRREHGATCPSVDEVAAAALLVDRLELV